MNMTYATTHVMNQKIFVIELSKNAWRSSVIKGRKLLLKMNMKVSHKSELDLADMLKKK